MENSAESTVDEWQSAIQVWVTRFCVVLDESRSNRFVYVLCSIALGDKRLSERVQQSIKWWHKWSAVQLSTTMSAIKDRLKIGDEIRELKLGRTLTSRDPSLAFHTLRCK